MSTTCGPDGQPTMSTEEQIDYSFIQRVIQELTQSCALPIPFPASAIPALILQAAQFFWENADDAVQARYYGIKNSDVCRNGINVTIKLPCQIMSVYGVHKLTDNYNFGAAMGDFSLERMVLNNSALASGAGGTLSDVFGSGTGYNLTDVMGALYEVNTYKQMFYTPLSYNYNTYSNELALLGKLGSSDIILQCFVRCKIQDLYKNYYFFRMVVCQAKRALSTIIGTYSFKLPGGVSINYDNFRNDAQEEIKAIEEYLIKQHAPDYIMMPGTV
jgi:hypothetical protein